MSIEKRRQKKLRAFRSLIDSSRAAAENIKVLRTLRTWHLAYSIAIKVLKDLGETKTRGTGPRATVKRTPPQHRRARACPSPCNDRGGQAPALR